MAVSFGFRAGSLALGSGGGGGIPSDLQANMDEVFNKKFDTSGQTYNSEDWPDDVNLMGPLPEKTASGSVASITDGADAVPIASWTIDVNPTLSGKSQIIATQAGKNLLAKDIVRYSNSLATLSECFAIHHGTYTVTIGTVENANNWRLSVLLMDSEGNALTDNSYKPSNDLQLATNRWRYGSNTTTKDFTITIVTDCYVRFFIELGDTSSSTTVSDSYLEVGSTSTTYTPYTAPVTNTVSLGRTIYGGSVDVANGTGTETWIKMDLGSVGWRYDTTHQTFYTLKNWKARGTQNIICTDYTTVENPSGGWNIQDGEIGGASNSQYIYIKDLNYTDPALFKTHLDGIYATFEAINYVDFTFSPITPTPETALGVNNFYGDSGDTEVTYRASGTVTLISKTITENGTYSAEDDNADGYSSVSVSVAGQSGMVVMDFSNITTSFSVNNVTYGPTGAVFDGTSDYIALSYFHAGMELEIDVTSMSVSANRRFVTSYENSGLCYRDGKWGFYNGSWYYSDITDGSYFSNSTVKIVVDNQNYWHIYKDGVLVFEPAGALAISNPQIGSRDGLAIDNAIITGVRMKEITS